MVPVVNGPMSIKQTNTYAYFLIPIFWITLIVMMLFTVLIFTIFVAASAQNIGENGTKSTRIGYGSLWLPRSFRITCCLDGYPIAENPQITRNWTHEESDYVIDKQHVDQTVPKNNGIESELSTIPKEKTQMESKCRVYHGSYLLSASALFTFDDFTGIGVICKCPEVSNDVRLDRNCRQLKPCLNNGYRSFSITSHCICPEPYFGERCDKYCDQGQRMKGTGGRDYCGCVPFYQGEECRDMVCLNGGTVVQRQCRCPPNFFGYHCEIDANRTSVVSRFHGYGEQGIYQDSDLFTRDVSGTIFSLVMIVVLVLSMYLLMKHRMKVQNRFAIIRREAVSRPSIGINPRRSNVIMPVNPRILAFHAIPLPDEGPPPYVIHPSRGRSQQQDYLPPLPSYDDATKLPTLTRTQLEEVISREEETVRSDSSLSVLPVNAETVTRVNNGSTEAAFIPSAILPQQSLELYTTVSCSDSTCVDISTTDNSFKYGKGLPERKSI